MLDELVLFVETAGTVVSVLVGNVGVVGGQPLLQHSLQSVGLQESR